VGRVGSRKAPAGRQVLFEVVEHDQNPMFGDDLGEQPDPGAVLVVGVAQRSCHVL
jgi:hypothetical protein